MKRSVEQNLRIEAIIRENLELTYRGIAKVIYKELGIELSDEAVRHFKRNLHLKSKQIKKPLPPVEEMLKADKVDRVEKQDKNTLKEKYTKLLKENDDLSKLLNILEAPRNYNLSEIIKVESSGDSEATAVVLASDWHVEQLVDGRKLAYPNNYNLAIAKARAEEFFQATVKLLKKEKAHQKIDTLVLAMLGDFITGNIHLSSLPSLQLGVAESCFLVEELFIRGIQYILDNTDVKIICPTACGNHSRITEKVWLSSEQDNSVETIIYYHIKEHFKNEKRFELIMPYGPDTFLDIYGMTIAFCHGHIGYRYQGGVGGLYVPIRRKIMSKFNKRQIYLVCMGHFHTYIQDSMFLVNGSQIGYDDYANAYGLDYDIPKQTFFLIDRKRQCRTVTVPIIYKS